MSKFKWIAATTLTAGLVLGGTTVATTAAMAGTNGVPNPDPTSPSGNPTPRDLPTCPLIVRGVPQPIPANVTPQQLRLILRLCRGIGQEDFHISLSDSNPAGVVNATGPVHFFRGRDRAVSDVLDVFFNRFGFPNSVNVNHEALTNVHVDLADCTIYIEDHDMLWTFNRGTGLYRNALGAGLYDLEGVFSFPTRDFKCTLPTTLTDVQAAADLNSQSGNGGLPDPFGYTIGVNGTGWATTLPQLRPKPTYFTPSTYPTSNPDNQDLILA